MDALQRERVRGYCEGRKRGAALLPERPPATSVAPAQLLDCAGLPVGVLDVGVNQVAVD